MSPRCAYSRVRIGDAGHTQFSRLCLSLPGGPHWPYSSQAVYTGQTYPFPLHLHRLSPPLKQECFLTLETMGLWLASSWLLLTHCHSQSLYTPITRLTHVLPFEICSKALRKGLSDHLVHTAFCRWASSVRSNPSPLIFSKYFLSISLI